MEFCVRKQADGAAWDTRGRTRACARTALGTLTTFSSMHSQTAVGVAFALGRRLPWQLRRLRSLL